MASVIATFSAGDAAVLVALISAFAAIIGPVVLLLVSSLKRIRAAAEAAVHNTQPNGHVDAATGEPTPPSPYDTLVRSHEYIIGQLHAAAAEAREAAAQAVLARAAIKAHEIKTEALAQSVEKGFAEAKAERDRLADILDKQVAGGQQFAQVVAAGALNVLARLDELDGGHTVEALRAQIEEANGHDESDDAE